MNTVTILVQGYAKKIKNGWKASSTCILIQNKNYTIIVDPGINRTLLLNSLKKQKLSLGEINMVFLTHYHVDHSLLAGIFENAVILDDEVIYDKDTETEYEGMIPNTNIKVVSTRGHALEHSSLLVKTKEGIVAIAGDVFWWTDEEEQKVSTRKELLYHKDPFVKNEKQLQKSRRMLLDSSDSIIPGHGKKFLTPQI